MCGTELGVQNLLAKYKLLRENLERPQWELQLQ